MKNRKVRARATGENQRLRRSRSSVLVLIAFSTAHLLGQGGASLVGTVRDAKGGVISGASVTALRIATGVQYPGTTTSAGDFALSDVPNGAYRLTVRAAGFEELQIEGIELHVATVLRQDATLRIATVQSQVEVESSTPLVNTETAEIGQLIDSRLITDLPLNERNIYSLIALTPGTETGVNLAARFTDAERPTIAGGRAGYTVFRIDGIDVNSQNLPSASIAPGVDAVQEFRAITQLAPASESGTSTVSIALRNGTNQFHGTAFDFFRNNALDAHHFFERTISTPSFQSEPDQLRYNQFGATLGGPIRHNRTFFFLSFHGTVAEGVTQQTGLYPTSQMLSGNFSGVNPLSGQAMRNFGSVLEPGSTTPFPGNIVPMSQWSGFAQKFLPVAFLPANCMACLAEGLGFDFAGEAPVRANQAQGLGRVDHRFNDRDSLFGTFLAASGNMTADASPNPISEVDTPINDYFVELGETHVFSAEIVNEFRLGYTRLRDSLQQKENANGEFTFQNTPTSLPSLYPTIDIAGYGTFGNGAISDRNSALEESWDGVDGVTIQRGRHKIQAGFEAIRARFWNTVNLNTFFVYADGLPSSLGFTGSGFADFLLGTPLEGVTFQGTGKASHVERSVYAGYMQDSWRISPTLTVSAGLRYEFPQRWHDANTELNRLGTLDTSAASEAIGGRFLLGGSANYYVPGIGVVEGTGPPLIRAALVDPAWHDFQPRGGIAWRPFGESTAFRAGAGIYYAIQDANSLAFEMLSPPFQYQTTVVNLSGKPLKDSQFFPASPPSGVATEGDDPTNRDPLLYQWTASVEHQIGRGILLSAEYLGNHGIHQPYSLLINTPSLPTGALLTTLEENPSMDVSLGEQRSPFSRVGLAYQYTENVGQSWYDALNLRAEGRLRRVTFTAAYTWSKALDDSSAEQQNAAVLSNLSLGKSYADYDHPQRFVSSWVYDLPSMGQGALWRRLASGWALSGIATFEAGPPYSITMGADTALVGGSVTIYPDLAGPLVHENIRASNGIYLSPQNFVAAPFGQYGALTRNDFHGPGYSNYDLGLLKTTSLNERLSLQLRGEFFNAFNHATFSFAGSSLATGLTKGTNGLPQIEYVDPSLFGRVTAGQPRVVQVAAKLLW